ncbi:DUF2203 domain-containing protein [Marinicrinis lubricantis]|uniref:DUF2203 domain-containing protein n=1 Tax=Marinicrinis lubricantis TaxID=2086470 RepID=A0ABW1ILG8_9BACL
MDKYFTLEEAGKLLPILEQELDKLQALKNRFDELYAFLKEMRYEGAEERALFQVESELEFLQIEAKLHIQNIFKQGVQLKSIELGLLDFPSRLEGEEVLLCWKQGEDGITHYHGVNEGFMGRKVIQDEDRFY